MRTKKNCQCGLFLSNALLGIHSGSNEGCIGIYGFALICFSSIWICRDCDATLFMETAKENKKACGYKRLCRWLCNRDFYAVHSLFS